MFYYFRAYQLPIYPFPLYVYVFMSKDLWTLSRKRVGEPWWEAKILGRLSIPLPAPHQRFGQGAGNETECDDYMYKSLIL